MPRLLITGCLISLLLPATASAAPHFKVQRVPDGVVIADRKETTVLRIRSDDIQIDEGHLRVVDADADLRHRIDGYHATFSAPELLIDITGAGLLIDITGAGVVIDVTGAGVVIDMTGTGIVVDHSSHGVIVSYEGSGPPETGGRLHLAPTTGVVTNDGLEALLRHRDANLGVTLPGLGVVIDITGAGLLIDVTGAGIAIDMDGAPFRRYLNGAR